MITLDEFESEHRKNIRQAARREASGSLGASALITFLLTPFVIVEGIFVPILGQVLVGGAVLLSLLYLYYRPSWRLITGGAAGILLSIFLLVAVSSFSPECAKRATYLLLAACTMVVAAYDVWIAVLLWRNFERASEKAGGTRPQG